jgi:hypothetical protein
MNWAEGIAHGFLSRAGHRVCHEPDGRVPPDFLIDGRVAVEVRTLNENYFEDDEVVGLERDAIRVVGMVRGEAGRITKMPGGASYWLALTFQRPIGDRKALATLRKQVRNVLKRFSSDSPPYDTEVEVAERLSLRFLPAEKTYPWRFRWGASCDLDAGGFVTHVYCVNIQHCVNEKTTAIHDYHHHYSAWWLLLVDPLWSYCEQDDSVMLADLKKAIHIPGNWDRVSVLCSRTGRLALDWDMRSR